MLFVTLSVSVSVCGLASSRTHIVRSLCLPIDLLLSSPYFIDTEIDWSTYVQQVEQFLGGTRDYGIIRGDTGPCVYPAGHLYVNSLFYYLSNHGRDIFTVQCLFIGVYLANLLLVYRICLRTNVVSNRTLINAVFNHHSNCTPI